MYELYKNPNMRMVESIDIYFHQYYQSEQINYYFCSPSRDGVFITSPLSNYVASVTFNHFNPSKIVT